MNGYELGAKLGERQERKAGDGRVVWDAVMELIQNSFLDNFGRQLEDALHTRAIFADPCRKLMPQDKACP